jgi:hypothetical protein
MIIMLEKKAKEILQKYLQAEMQGNDQEAEQYENQLNDGGWYITYTAEGPTVKKKENGASLPNVDEAYLPKDSGYQPYTASGSSGSNKTLWITLGVIAGLTALTFLVIYLVKRRKNAAARL